MLESRQQEHCFKRALLSFGLVVEAGKLARGDGQLAQRPLLDMASNNGDLREKGTRGEEGFCLHHSPRL